MVGFLADSRVARPGIVETHRDSSSAWHGRASGAIAGDAPPAAGSLEVYRPFEAAAPWQKIVVQRRSSPAK